MLYKIIGLCNADLQRCTNFVQRTKLMNQTIQADSVVVLAYETNFTRAAPVAERLGALSLKSGAGSSPALASRETSQVLLAGVSGGFSRGSPVFAPLIGPSHMS